MEDLKVLIVEDEILIAEDLKDNLKKFGITKIRMVHDKEEAMLEIRTWKPDILLLDIRLEKDTEGIDIGEYLMKNNPIPFIYITAHSDVELIKKIVKTNPAGYITKPFKKSDLYAAISLISEDLKKSNSKSINIKDGYNTVRLSLDQILFVESDGNYINVQCENKKYALRQSLESLAQELDETQFFRIHRSYLINISKIEKYSSKDVTVGGYDLPLSRSALQGFKAMMGGM